MAHPYHHALSSVKKWGGEVSDYLPLHTWFDLMWTGKQPILCHRAVCHISYSPALRMGIINGRELRVAPQFEFPLWWQGVLRPGASERRQRADSGHSVSAVSLAAASLSRSQRNAGMTFDANSSRCVCAQRGGSPGGSVHE
jgi:hypothetical protein